jgi:hypothetical protein
VKKLKVQLIGSKAAFDGLLTIESLKNLLKVIYLNLSLMTSAKILVDTTMMIDHGGMVSGFPSANRRETWKAEEGGINA